MTLKKSQKIVIGIIILSLLVIAVILIWNNKKTDMAQCPERISCKPPGECKIPNRCEGKTQIAW